jgi:hypothetical protein
MMHNYSLKQIIFAISVGGFLAYFVYQSTVKPPHLMTRQNEEHIIQKATLQIRDMLFLPYESEIIDPINTDRDVGKTYIYPAGKTWQVSGFYRRNYNDSWHPWLITLDEEGVMINLSIKDDFELFDDQVLLNSSIAIKP